MSPEPFPITQFNTELVHLCALYLMLASSGRALPGPLLQRNSSFFPGPLPFQRAMGMLDRWAEDGGDCGSDSLASGQLFDPWGAYKLASDLQMRSLGIREGKSVWHSGFWPGLLSPPRMAVSTSNCTFSAILLPCVGADRPSSHAVLSKQGQAWEKMVVTVRVP